MPAKSNTEEFIRKSKIKHGDTYDYSKVDYKGKDTPVIIICPEHGEFPQTPHDHLSGNGCPKCGLLKRAQKRRSNTEQFIKRAKEIHGDKYDYSVSEYNGAGNPITIICKKHGPFSIPAGKHIQGKGCQKCGNERKGAYHKVSLEDFIRRAKEKHGDKYDYSLVDLKNTWSKVDIVCPIHGVFSQKVNDHLRGIGCPECGKKFGISEREVLSALQDKYGNVEYQKPFPFLKSKTSYQKLDYYLPDYNIGIEYQGSQHFGSNRRFGGDVGYEKVKDRDARKFQKCERNGIKMFYISFERNIPPDYFAPVYTDFDALSKAIDEYIKTKQPVKLNEQDLKKIINDTLKKLL